MRRTTRKALTNVVLFLGALIIIIYLGHQGSTPSVFAWTRVRYQTTAPKLPPPHGICPGLKDSTKPALVVSHVHSDGDLKWLESLRAKYHLCVYDVDGSIDSKATTLRVPANRGHEAMAYLTFLIDNYSDVQPEGAVFVHGSRWAWHNDAPDYDNAALLTTLNLSAALQPHGYHNLRCDWSSSTCEISTSPPQGSLDIQVNSKLQPWDARLVSDAAIPGALVELFGGSNDAGASGEEHLRLGRADAVRSQCCAQFVVSRSRIWHHSREEYVALRQWLLDEGAAPRDDRVAGRILSYVWHILFMQHESARLNPSDLDGIDLEQLNSKACPRADECYCRLYGRCNLEGCIQPGSCLGQYTIPPNFRLPADWGSRHS